MKKNNLIILIGPSCSGKTYLQEKLIELTQKTKIKDIEFGSLISTTTRPPRSGEVNGTDYHFITKKEFDEKIKNNDFIEYVEFGGMQYGVTKSELERLFEKGLTPVIVVEPNGAKELHDYALSKNWSPASIFINVPQKMAISRFYDRFLSDIEDKKDCIDYYSNRIHEVLINESQWRTAINYDKIIPASNSQDDAIMAASDIVKEILLHNSGESSIIFSDKNKFFKPIKEQKSQPLISALSNFLTKADEKDSALASTMIFNMSQRYIDNDSDYSYNK